MLEGTGYGEYARLLAWAIDAAGHDLRTRCRPYRPLKPEDLGRTGELAMERLGHRADDPVDISLIVHVPSAFKRLAVKRALNIGLSMTESDIPPPGYVRSCNNGSIDVFAIPSEWNRTAFREVGVPTTIIHPPVAPDLLEMGVRRRGDVLTYLSNFSWSSRHKDPHSLLEAFCRAFDHSDPVRLVIKTQGPSDEQIAEDVHEAMKRAGSSRAPEIKVICGAMSRKDVLGLYAESDVYVSSHHGEGWGLPIFEAMAIGMPAIATAYSAPLEYMDSETGYLVDYIYDQGDGRANVDVDDLARKMRRVFTHPDEAALRGSAARATLRSRFTAQHTANQITKAALLATNRSPGGD
jgi:glycosyltransferase involved in cell wall biosynthesis